MAAWRSMVDEPARPRAEGGARPVGSHRAPHHYRPHRFLFPNELDGPDRDERVDEADMAVADRERSLYGDRDHDQRVGWSKEDF